MANGDELRRNRGHLDVELVTGTLMATVYGVLNLVKIGKKMGQSDESIHATMHDSVADAARRLVDQLARGLTRVEAESELRELAAKEGQKLLETSARMGADLPPELRELAERAARGGAASLPGAAPDKPAAPGAGVVVVTGPVDKDGKPVLN